MPNALAPLTIYLDLVNKVAYSNVNGGIFQMPAFFYAQVVTFYIYPMKPTPGATTRNQFTQLGTTINGMNVSMGPLVVADSSGFFGGPVTLTPGVDAGNQPCWSGSMNLATTTIEAALGGPGGTTAYVGSFLQINYKDSDNNEQPGYLAPCVVNNNVKTPGTVTPVPPPGVQYATIQEMLQLFVPLRGVPGQTFTLVSQSGTHTRTLGENNDGSPMDISQ